MFFDDLIARIYLGAHLYISELSIPLILVNTLQLLKVIPLGEGHTVEKSLKTMLVNIHFANVEIWYKIK
jgi:hypothetical protein